MFLELCSLEKTWEFNNSRVNFVIVEIYQCNFHLKASAKWFQYTSVTDIVQNI